MTDQIKLGTYILTFFQIFVIQSRKIVFNAGMQEGDQMEIH